MMAYIDSDFKIHVHPRQTGPGTEWIPTISKPIRMNDKSENFPDT